MAPIDHRAGLFPALLKHWRGRRGLSQLDLALAADVSSRHVSFLETGRSTPTSAMVLRLARALEVPLRHINAMLEAAGHPPMYPEPRPEEPLPDAIAGPLALMKQHAEPFPLVVVNRYYDVIDLNAGALRLFEAVLPQRPDAPLNLARLTFDPEGAQALVANFNEVGPALLWRLQREALAAPEDAALRALVDEILQMPTVGADWREPDLGVPAAHAMPLVLRSPHGVLSFVTTVTVFQAPQSVLLDELRIEMWYPTDEATTEVCRTLARAS